MIRTFGTWEEAAIYAAYMRSEGHFAELLDLGASSFYGPAAVGGVRVVVSDEPVTELENGGPDAGWETEPPPSPAHDSEPVRVIRMAVVGIVALSLAITVREWFIVSREIPGGAAGRIYHIAEFLSLQAIVWLPLVLVVDGMTSCIRSDQRKGIAGFVFWLVLLVMLPAVIMRH